MRISVVVPTYNRRAIVTRTLERLFAQDCPRDSFEILVVVDGSTDGSAEALGRMRAPCALRVLEQENRGLAGARNTGFRAAQGEVVLFLDDDMRCELGLVAAHLTAHCQEEGIASFGALFLSPESPPSLAAECFKREIGAAHLSPREAEDTTWLREDCVFSNASLRRETLLSLGGFDESFRMREDLEFGQRLFATGVRPVYLPNAIAHQYYAKTAADLIRDSEAFAEADLNLARKHPQLRLPAQVSSLADESGWKARVREWAARHPALVDNLLGPLCAAGERWIGVAALRNVGVRALQFRRRAHWLHAVRRLEAHSYAQAEPEEAKKEREP
ncbi:MAG TPA: glycosyltransferase family A protein [Terracidiphilus sp.]|nr:glycosyltransferase family A protein [Terracidiphilus sp.]